MKLYEEEEYIYQKIPIRIYSHLLEKEQIYSPLHWHRSIEIDLAVEGRIVLVVDGKSKVMKEGDCEIVNSGELHSLTWVERDDSYKGITLLISKSFLDTWLGENIYLICSGNSKIQKQIRDILMEFGEIKESYGRFYKATLMELLFRLVRLLGEFCIDESVGKREKRGKGIDHIKNVVNYIDEHYQKNISLNSVAEEFHYSSAHLSRLFKEHIGYTFYEYLQDVRLLNTMEQLKKHPDILFIDCALENGFPNVKSFITTFKKTYKCTPSEWRKSRS